MQSVAKRFLLVPSRMRWRLAAAAAIVLVLISIPAFLAWETFHAIHQAQQERRRPSALELAGPGVGRFKKGPRDLSTNRKHLEGFGE